MVEYARKIAKIILLLSLVVSWAVKGEASPNNNIAYAVLAFLTVEEWTLSNATEYNHLRICVVLLGLLTAIFCWTIYLHQFSSWSSMQISVVTDRVYDLICGIVLGCAIGLICDNYRNVKKEHCNE